MKKVVILFAILFCVLSVNEVSAKRPNEYGFISIAASGVGLVVRLDVDDGSVDGVYQTSPNCDGNPSRTTVDFEASTWVGNRKYPSVCKIGLVLGGTRSDVDGKANPNGDYLAPPYDYPFDALLRYDKNNDGLIKTSQGVRNGKHHYLPWVNGQPTDELITYIDKINSQCSAINNIRHISVDGSNNVWVGGYPGLGFVKIDDKTKTFTDSYCNPQKGGYGGLVDSSGVLWSSTFGSVIRIDVNSKTQMIIPATGTYGLGIDTKGNVWANAYTSRNCYKISPDGKTLQAFNKGSADGRGCAVTPADNNVWLVDYSMGKVIRMNNDGVVVKEIPVGGGGPMGVSVDYNGKVWVTCYNSAYAKRIDPSINQVDLEVFLGAGYKPYNYSDMTGSTLRSLYPDKIPPIKTDTIDGGGTYCEGSDGVAVGLKNSQLGVNYELFVDGAPFSPRVVISGTGDAVSFGKFVKYGKYTAKATSNLTGKTADVYGSVDIESIGLVILPNSIYFKNKIPNGTKYDTTITVTAKNTDVNVTNIVSSNPLFTVAPANFTLVSGQNQIITVSFTPTDSSYQYSKFTIENDVCESNFYATGGFKGKKAKVPTLKLTHPNGGEVFVVGTDTVMTWEGVLPTDTVNLEYSIDNGKNWIFLTNKATDLKWVWKNVPKPPSNICLARVSQQGASAGLWSWGRNVEGQLGDGTNTNSNIPKPIENTSDWLKIEAGYDFSICIKNDTTLWACGQNASGQLGDGTLNQRNKMLQIGKDTDWKTIASGGGHNLAIKKDNSLWSWGDNYNGQLGDGTTTSKSISLQLGNEKNWKSISLGYAHSAAVKTDGTLWSWGQNWRCGQLGDGTLTDRHIPVKIGNDNNWESVYCSDSHTLALKNDGTLWAWGCNTYGQLGDGTTIQRNAPIQVGIDNDWAFVAVSTGDWGKSHTIALKRDGTLWAWGANQCGQIGDGTTTQRNIPIKVGKDNDWYCVALGCYYTVAIKRDGSLWSWGYNEFGQLGDGTNIDKHTPLRIGNANDWDTVVCGNEHTLALKFGASGQSDVSDAVWSIVMPELVSKDIDMKQCLVGSMKDSVVTPFISNTGTYKCRIDSIYFTGADAGAFSLIAGIPEYYINNGENKFAEFRFKPTRVGLHSAKIKIITQADTLTQNIIGEGVQQSIEVVGDFIDFGKVGVGFSKDTIQALTIKNIGTTPIQITKTNHNKPNDYDFTKGNSAGFILAPNEIKKMDLRFAPSELGRTSGLLEFHYDGVGSPAIVQLFGEGIGGKVIIDNDSAYPGEKRFLRLRLGNEIKPSAQTGVTQFRVKLSYNPTILTMLDSKAVKTFDLIKETVEITSPWDNVAELLGEFEVEAGLGNAEFSDLVIEEFNWLDAQGNVIDFGTEKQNGTFKLLGICYEGGARLVNPNGIAGIIQIKPNPASEDIEIGINLIEKGYSIVSIYNSNGEKMKEYNMTGKKGLQTINLDISDFSNGLYFVQLLTPTIVKNQKLMIIK